MIHYQHPVVPLSLQELRRLGDQRIAEARRTIEQAQRVARQAAEVHAETRRLHLRFHPTPPNQNS